MLAVALAFGLVVLAAVVVLALEVLALRLARVVVFCCSHCSNTLMSSDLLFGR